MKNVSDKSLLRTCGMCPQGIHTLGVKVWLQVDTCGHRKEMLNSSGP